MKHLVTLKSGAVIATVLILSSCNKHEPVFCDCAPQDIVVTTKVFSSGFNAPRGITFGPDGYLYVAEGGLGGSNSSTTCMQVLPPVGPYTGSNNGSRISRVDPAGNRTTYVDNLPSSQTAATQGGLISGVGDVAFVGNTLYAVFAGAGCSHGVPDIPNGVIKVKPDRTWTMLANLSAFQMANPVKNPNIGDFEPDGTWYSMHDVNGSLYAVEPNHGELDKIALNGDVSRVIDISAYEGHIVPTASTYRDGNFYVGNLDLFPIVAGSASIYKITPEGAISVYATGFTTVLGVVFDKAGAMYVLENTTGNPFPTPMTGDIIRVDPSGVRSTIVTGLNVPTAITFGPNGKLYVSNGGFGAPPGAGEILEVEITCSKKGGNLGK